MALKSLIPLSVAKALVRFDAERLPSASESAKLNALSAGVQAGAAIPLAGFASQTIGLSNVSDYRAETFGGSVKALVGTLGPTGGAMAGAAGMTANAVVHLGWSAVDAVQAAAWSVIAESEQAPAPAP